MVKGFFIFIFMLVWNVSNKMIMKINIWDNILN